jgi:hypothetical protein
MGASMMLKSRLGILPLNQSDGGCVFEQRPSVISVSRHPEQQYRGANCAQGCGQRPG